MLFDLIHSMISNGSILSSDRNSVVETEVFIEAEINATSTDAETKPKFSVFDYFSECLGITAEETIFDSFFKCIGLSSDWSTKSPEDQANETTINNSEVILTSRFFLFIFSNLITLYLQRAQRKNYIQNLISHPKLVFGNQIKF